MSRCRGCADGAGAFRRRGQKLPKGVLVLAFAFTLVLPLSLVEGRSVDPPRVDPLPVDPLPVGPPPGDSLALLEAIAHLEHVQAAGGWPEIPPGPTLRLGDTGPRVAALRARLMASGDLPADMASGADSVFDPVVEAGVRRVQARHGIVVDGLAGPETLRVLEVSVDRRIRQIKRSLEARRAFVAEPGPVRVLINLPAFEAWVLEEGVSPTRHRVIIGRVDRRTPVLTAHIGHVVLAPYWTVPPGILRRDLLPAIRRDPQYLGDRRIRVLDRATGEESDPAGFSWDDVTAAELDTRYIFRQDPGPWNALGKVKFIFPNPYLVYLHDTPDRHLFDAPQRAFSSGCIRMEGAMDLAERLLLSRVTGWTADRIRQVAAGSTERWIRLPEAIPIQTVYWTVWAGPDGEVHFAEDLYGWEASDSSPSWAEACA